MFIKSVELNNFKGFKDKFNFLKFKTPDGTPGSGLNIFIGENNSGKSTVFEAINFLKDGSKKDLNSLINKQTNEKEFYVELSFSGNIQEVIENHIQNNKIAVLKKHIDSSNTLKTRRTGSIEGSPEADEKVKKIGLWSEESETFENPTGIDAPFKKLYDNNFIWADTSAEDEAKFGATTLCGVLLKEIAEAHTQSADYKKFSQEFHKIFNDPASQLRTTLAGLESTVNTYVNQQFGKASIKFSFEELGIDSFFKSAKILVDDGTEVPMNEKGHGLQRAVALALLQVYANIVSKKDTNKTDKPFFLFIDEPEICLHPIAQTKLLESLIEISKTKQVFITTHSPFFIKSNFLSKFGIYTFKKTNNENYVKEITLKGVLNRYPSFGEIIFNAYNMATEDFHDELYGHLQSISDKKLENNFDEYLVQQGVTRTKTWIRELKDGTAGKSEARTIQVFIRNKNHHPENQYMNYSNYSNTELNDSIVSMIRIINGVQLGLQPATIAGAVA